MRIQIQAGAATPAPPVGTALGPHGINIMDFCKAYNAQTESQRGMVVPAEITIHEDRSFTFITKTPPASKLLLQAAGLEKGSVAPRREKAGTVTTAQVREIAETKRPTSTRSTSKARWRRSRAPPARWESTSSTSTFSHESFTARRTSPREQV